MRKRKSKWLTSFILYTLSTVLFINYQTALFTHIQAADYSEPTTITSVEIIEEEIVEELPVMQEPIVAKTINEKIVEEATDEVQTVSDESPFTDEEISLIALLTMAEAEGESEEGKRLVIDTVLNRVDHARFPDTVTEVIYQPSQFSSMWNGRVDRCYVDEDICELVREEIEQRNNTEVIFFTAGDYGKYGTPMFSVGNHYFSSYE